MSDKREFHLVLSALASAHAQNTLAYILEEARRIEAGAKTRSPALVLLPDECRSICQLFNGANVGLVLLDATGTILWSNRVLSGWVNLSPDTIVGQSLWKVSRSGDVVQRQGTLQKAITTGAMQLTFDSNSMGQTVRNCVIPLPGLDPPGALVISSPVARARVFEQAFRPDERRIIE